MQSSTLCLPITGDEVSKLHYSSHQVCEILPNMRKVKRSCRGKSIHHHGPGRFTHLSGSARSHAVSIKRIRVACFTGSCSPYGEPLTWGLTCETVKSGPWAASHEAKSLRACRLRWRPCNQIQGVCYRPEIPSCCQYNR